MICYWYYWWECDMCMTLTPREATTVTWLLWQYLLIALDRLWPVNLSIFILLLELLIMNLNATKDHIEFWGSPLVLYFTVVIPVMGWMVSWKPVTDLRWGMLGMPLKIYDLAVYIVMTLGLYIYFFLGSLQMHLLILLLACWYVILSINPCEDNLCL